MPLPKLAPKKLIIEPAAKRVIDYVSRDDIPCNVENCARCQQLPGYKSVFSTAEPLVIPSLGVLLRYRHVLQFLSAQQIVYLVSILNDLREADYLFCNQLMKSFGNKQCLFHDQVNQSTRLNSNQESNILEVVGCYYKAHGARPVVLGELQELYQVYTAHIAAEYFFSAETHTALGLQLDLESFLACRDAELTDGYLEHLPTADLKQLAASDAVLRGQFKAFKGGSSGFIQHPKFGRVNFPGRYCVNRALDFDVVYFRLFLQPPDAEAVVQNAQLYPLEQNIYEAIYQQTEAKQYFGAVVGIESRAVSRFCGTLEKMFYYTFSDGKFSVHNVETHDFCSSRVVTVNEKLPKFFVRAAASLASFCGYRCEFLFYNWDRKSQLPSCTLCEALGPVADPDVESEVILRERYVRHFDLEQVQEILDELPRQAIDRIDAYRVDVSDELVCSVDPPGCKDIDDALHFAVLQKNVLEKRWGKYLLDQKNYKAIDQQLVDHIYALQARQYLCEVGVHIADVSYFVRAGSSIDQEAGKRCTSVYLYDRRIDMLPKLLSEQVCSLVADGKRFCFSCLFLFDLESKDYLIYRFAKTIVKNNANLSYQEAQALVDLGDAVKINDKFDTPQLKAALTSSLRNLLSLSCHLKDNRMRQGALYLDSPEAQYKLDENRMPVGLDPHGHLPTMSMIEEFMLLANFAAAETMLKKFPSTSLLRSHPVSSSEYFDDLKKKLKRYDLEMDASSKDAISASIRHLSEQLKDRPQMLETVRTLLTRCMMLAKYFASGNATEPDYLHFGLALKYYTHFTSPIRRYSDILVHRILAACITIDSNLYSLDALTYQCKLLNERKEQADRASRDSSKMFGVLYLLKMSIEGKGDYCEQASVVSITENKIYLMVMDMGAELDVSVSGYLSYDRMELTLANGRKIAMFDRLPVKVYYDFEKPYRFRFKAQLM